MLRYIKLFSIIAVLFLSHAAMAGEKAITAGSVWKNEGGSIFTITSIDPASGQMSGNYINNMKGYKCQGTPYPVTGYVYGNMISWSVSWRTNKLSDIAGNDCNSVTGWTGYYDSASNKILTDWNLAYLAAPSIYKIMKDKDTFSPSP